MADWAPTWRVLVLVGLLDTCQALLIPRTTFITGSPGRSLTHFTSPGIENTTTLLLSDDGIMLYVGARDSVFSLNVSQPGIMEISSKVNWSPAEKELQDCTRKGKSEMDCHNFVRVLQFLNTTHMYACGTFAFSPTCTYINRKDFSFTGQEVGRGRCPYDPYQRNTAIVVDGELYTGTVANFMGDRHVISRFMTLHDKSSHTDLKLDDSQDWLKDPTFVGSTFIPSEGKVYYFFRETSMEYTFINDYAVSRIAQVCTSDVGGKLILQNRWTTFAKAQLRCQADKELPFNIIQDIVTLPPPEGDHPDDTLFYGVFSSQWSMTSGQSAVCSFRLGDIKNVFAGNYMELNRNTLRWGTRHKEKVANPGECGLHNATDKLRFVKENFLAEESVEPVDQGVVLLSPDQLYSRIAAQRTQASNGRDFTVLFLLTESGFLHKTVLLDKGPYIIEEIQVLKQPQAVKNVLLSITKGVVFVGSSEGVFEVPVSNCSFYSNCAECVLAQDPFCGWDRNRLACVEISTTSFVTAQDVEFGNVNKACKVPRSRTFAPAHIVAPPEELVYVQLNTVVRLHCPSASRLAALRWESPKGSLDLDLYLQSGKGSLSFLVTPLTLGDYHCVAEENGHVQTLAVISVMQHVSPRSISHGPTQSQPSTAVDLSLGKGKEATEVGAETVMNEITVVWGEEGREEVTEVGSGTNTLPVSDPATILKELPIANQAEDAITTPVKDTASAREKSRFFSQVEELLPSNDVRSYYMELVAVSVLLMVSLCMLVAGGIYVWHQRSPVKTALKDCARTDEEAVSTQERAPLSEDQQHASALTENKQEQVQLPVDCTTPRGPNQQLSGIPI